MVIEAEKISVKDFTVKKVERNDITKFIEENHYSKSINGCKASYCFALYNGDMIIGAAFFGYMAMANQWKKYGECEKDVIELRRLCCVDDTPRNTESFFIGKMIKWLKQNTEHKILVSYADEEYGHTGIIYKATNFKYHGMTKGAKVIIWNGKKYHDKSIRAYYKGKLKPFAQRLRDALDSNEAYYSETKGKHTYTYVLRKK